MTGLDTNVLVRYLAQDDVRQSAIATRWIEQELSRDDTAELSVDMI
jgi:predicted nucleic-acid-binding protein